MSRPAVQDEQDEDKDMVDVTVKERTFGSVFFFLTPGFIRRRYVAKYGTTEKGVTRPPNHGLFSAVGGALDGMGFLRDRRASAAPKAQLKSRMDQYTEQFKAKELSVDEALKYLEVRKRAAFDDELLKYFMYLVFFIVLILWIIPVSLSYEQVDFAKNYFSSSSNDEFVDYTSVLTDENFYDFLSTTISEGLYVNDGVIGNNLKLVGLPLLRQIRVKPSKCQLKDVYETCYSYYRVENEQKEPFGPSYDPTRYTYTSGYPVLEPSFVFTRDWHVGPHDSYGEGAFALEMPYGKNASLEFIEQLKNDTWIDRATRAVAIDFGFANGDLGFITTVEYLFEFSPTGRIEPTQRILSFPLLVPDKNHSYGEFVFYLIFILGGVYFVVSEFMQFLELGKDYFKEFWNIFEMINYTIFFILMIVIAVYIEESRTNIGIFENELNKPQPEVYVDTQSLSIIFFILQSIIGISCMFAFMKVFKFFRLNNRLNLLGQTLSLATGDLTAYVVIFIVIFIAFSFQGYYYFGYQVKEFHNFPSSLLSTFLILSGNNDYDSWRYASPILAPMFFLLFVVFVILILVNMFVAILSEYYEQAKEDSRKRAEEQKEHFGGDTDYDLSQRIASTWPHIQRFRNQGSVKLYTNDPVFVLFLDKATSDLEKIEGTIKTNEKVKFLMIRSNAVDTKGLLNVLGDKSNKFSPSSSPYPYVLSLAKVDMSNLKEELPDTWGDVEKVKQNLGKESFVLYRSLDDFNVDQALFLHMGMDHHLRFAGEILDSLWAERMTLKGHIPTFVTDAQIERILLKVIAQEEFNRRSMNESNDDINSLSLRNFITEKTKKEGLDSLEDKSIDSIVQEFMDEKQKSSVNLNIRFDEFVRELKIDLSMSDPDSASKKSMSNLAREVNCIFKMFPQSCFTPMNKEIAIQKYKPRTINTSGISLERFKHLTDEMGEHIHDQWTVTKLDQGWKYGPVRNNAEKIHHNMVPYAQLTDGDKEYDRKMAQKTIKLILYFGYDIIPGPEMKDVRKTTYPQYKDNLPSDYALTMPDLSRIELAGEVVELADILAENAHDEWARGRQLEGWKYGTGEGADARKETEYMQPYYMMEQGQRENDLNTVRATLQFLMYKGYSIERRTLRSRLTNLWTSATKCFRRSNEPQDGTGMESI